MEDNEQLTELEQAIADRLAEAIIAGDDDPNGWIAAYLRGCPIEEVLDRATRDDT